MRRLLVPILVACVLALVMVPANARWGVGHVDTWLRRGDHEVGRDAPGVPTLSIHLTAGVPKKVHWLIENLGGQPSTHAIGFNGCHSGDGIGFRYYTLGGREVSWKVTHDGFVYPSVAEGHTRRLAIRLFTAHAGNSTTCVLEATGMSGRDYVGLNVSS